MLFEAQLLFQLPLTLAMYSPVLAPFFSLLLIAAFIGLLYLAFQTHVGRNVLGLIGGAALINFFFSDSNREPRRNYVGFYTHSKPDIFPHHTPPMYQNNHGHRQPSNFTSNVYHQHGSQDNARASHQGRVHGHF